MAVTVTELVHELRGELRSGAIAGDLLDSYLTKIETAATYQHEMEVWKVNFQTAIEAAQAGLKAGILINGAASIALLTFAQSLIVAGRIPASVLKTSLGAFLAGVGLAAFATACAYLAHVPKHQGLRSTYQVAAIVLGLGAFVAFVVGAVLGARMW